MMPADPDHARARQERLPARDSAPHVDPGILGWPLVRKELFAQDRVNAFSADDDAAALAWQWPAVNVLKMRNRLRAVVFDTDAAPARDHFVGACAFHERIKEDHLQVAAMNGELRHVIAGETTGGLAINKLAEAVVEAILPCGHRDLCECILKTKRA